MRATQFAHVLTVIALTMGGVLLSGDARAEDETFEAAYRALIPGTVAELEGLAEACHAAKLYGWRNETYERVLLLAGDHKRARTWLKYRRSADGHWKRGSYKPPRNLKEPSDAQRVERRAVGERFAGKVLKLMASSSAPLPTARHQALLRLLVRFAPEREDLRKELGEVRARDGRWLLAESVSAATLRAVLAKRAKQTVSAQIAPATARPTAADNALRLGWSAIYQAPHVRLMGTVTKEELVLAVKCLEACYPVFDHVFGKKEEIPKPLVVYLLAASSDKAAILKHHPAADTAYRRWAAKLQSSWLPKTSSIWIFASDRDLRLEWCSRQIMGNRLWRRFGIRGTPGWAFEGCGLYLSHLIAGQRRTFFVRRTQYGKQGSRENDLWDRLRAKDANWREEARKLLASDEAPDLRLLLGKNLNAMNTEDMLAAFAVCAFLLEGRPRQLPSLLESVGRKKQDSIDVLTAAGLDPQTLEIKLRRWLAETR